VPADPRFLMVPRAPTPVAPFSHLVDCGEFVFVTGQMPTWPDDDARPRPRARTRRRTA